MSSANTYAQMTFILAALMCFGGCSHPAVVNDSRRERILDQPVKEIIGEANVSVAGEDQGTSADNTVLRGRKFAVGGRFRTIGEAAAYGFRPSVIVAYVSKKNRDGILVTYGTCTCPVTGSEGEFTFEGTMQAMTEPGEYTLQASYKGAVFAEGRVTVK